MNTNVSIRILPALALLISLSCATDPQATLLNQMKQWQASDFVTAPGELKLAEAVAIGDRAAIDGLVAQGANVNAHGQKGIPLLMWAMAKDNVAGFEGLLTHGADLKALVNDPAFTRKGELTEKVIEVAAGAEKSEFLQVAMRRGFSPDYVADDYMNESLLFTSVRTHKVRNAGVLLDAGANINHVNANDCTPILLASDRGYYEMVFFLLSRGADPCIKAHGYDLPGMLKEYGVRGVSDKEMPHFQKVVAELKKRNLITDADIENANNNATPFLNRQPKEGDTGNP